MSTLTAFQQKPRFTRGLKRVGQKSIFLWEFHMTPIVYGFFQVNTTKTIFLYETTNIIHLLVATHKWLEEPLLKGKSNCVL